MKNELKELIGEFMKWSKEFPSTRQTFENFSEWLSSQPEEEWVPEIGEKYWRVDSMGKVYDNRWDNYEVDNAYLAVGNCYRTEKLALEASERVKKAYKNI